MSLAPLAVIPLYVRDLRRARQSALYTEKTLRSTAHKRWNEAHASHPRVMTLLQIPHEVSEEPSISEHWLKIVKSVQFISQPIIALPVIGAAVWWFGVSPLAKLCIVGASAVTTYVTQDVCIGVNEIIRAEREFYWADQWYRLYNKAVTERDSLLKQHMSFKLAPDMEKRIQDVKDLHHQLKLKGPKSTDDEMYKLVELKYDAELVRDLAADNRDFGMNDKEDII